MLRPITANVWVYEQPFSLFGVRVGVRSTLIRLEDGRLWLHSPGPVDDALAAEIDALGPVAAVVAPNLFHHLYAGAAAKRWPDATLYATPGLSQKQPALSGAEALAERPPELWRHQLDQVLIGGMPKANEQVFFHRESKTLIVSDLLFNLRNSDHWWTRTFMGWNGAYGALAVSRFFKSNIKDASAARAGADRVLQWDFKRVILAHGEVLDGGTGDLDARMLVAEALAPIG